MIFQKGERRLHCEKTVTNFRKRNGQKQGLSRQIETSMGGWTAFVCTNTFGFFAGPEKAPIQSNPGLSSARVRRALECEAGYLIP